MNSYKSTVSLSRIAPGSNPRKDFGDIALLAEAINATGGQPVNPIIVVLDGDTYRIVDGERRWRALKRIYGEDGTTDVLVFPDYDEADQAVAMLATDDKKTLDPSESARGFQRMMLLGVSDKVAAKAIRRKVADVRKAKAVANEAPEQATLDQMICAAEFESPDDRSAILSAKPNMWGRVADDIRERIRREQYNAPIKKALEDLGVDVRDDGLTVKEADDYRYLRFVGGTVNVTVLSKEHETKGLVACPYDYGTGYYVYEPRSQSAAEEPQPIAEAPEHDKDKEREDAAITSLRDSIVHDLAIGRYDTEWRRILHYQSMKVQTYANKGDRVADALQQAYGVTIDENGEASGKLADDYTDAYREIVERMPVYMCIDLLTLPAYPLSTKQIVCELLRYEKESNPDLFGIKYASTDAAWLLERYEAEREEAEDDEG